jgi:hypothetical protein
MQKKLQLMHERDIRQSDHGEIRLVGKTMDLHNEMNHLLLELLNHPRPMTLEHDVAVVANVNQLPNKVL